VEEGSRRRDISGGFVLSQFFVFLGVQGCVRKLSLTTVRIMFKLVNWVSIFFVRDQRRWGNISDMPLLHPYLDLDTVVLYSNNYR
jgi:hypothetical protein